MSKLYLDSSNIKISFRSLNVLFFALIMLCSYSTITTKLNNKISKNNANLNAEIDSELPSLNLPNPASIAKKLLSEDSLRNMTGNLTSALEGNLTSALRGREKPMQKEKNFEFQVAQLDSQNQTLDVSQFNLTGDALNCYNKFQLVISNFPFEVQTQIVSEFRNYFGKKQTAQPNSVFDSSLCCLSQNLIKNTAQKFNAITKAFTGLVSQQEKDCKNGFACFRGNEVLLKAMGKDMESSYKNTNQQKLKGLLEQGKRQNSNLIRCLLHMQKVSVRNLGMMCANDNLLNLTFVLNADNKLVRPKKFPDDDFDLFSSCGEYVKNFNLYPEEITNAFVDSLNFLLGSEQCNYFSNFFGAKGKGRRALNPKMFAKKQEKKGLLESSKDFVKGLFGGNKRNTVNNLLNSTLNLNASQVLQQLREQVPKGDSSATLIERWANCSRTVDDFAKETVESLRTNLPKTLASNPNGLQGGALFGVNFHEILNKFDVSSNPQFLLSCESVAGCKLNLGKNSNANNVRENFNATNVVSRNNVTLQYSCCDRVCVVYYNNQNNVTNLTDNTASLNPFDSVVPVEMVQTEENENQFFDKLLNTVGLGKSSTNTTSENARPRRTRNWILSGAEVFEVRPNNQYALKSNERQMEKLQSALKTLRNKPVNVSFSDQGLLDELSNYAQNPNNYVNDLRLRVALMLNVKLENGTLSTLSEYMLNNLLGNQNLLHLACTQGKCTLTQNGQAVRTLELAPNTNLTFAGRHLSGRRDNNTSNNTRSEKNNTEGGFLKSVTNFFTGNKNNESPKSENSQPNAFDSALDLLGGEEVANAVNKVSRAVKSRVNQRELYYRPNYQDLQANFTLDSLDAESLRKLLDADVSRIAVRFSPEFNRTSFLEQLNSDFPQSFSSEFECSEYFCVLVARSTSNLVKPNEGNSAKSLFMQVRQRKPFTFDYEKISVTQKKCVVKNILLNGKQEPEFFDLAGSADQVLSNLNNNPDNTLNSTLSVANRTQTNVVQRCNLDTPYTTLPISNDCLSSLVGHCQKSNFFDLYNRYTRGIASSDDLPVASAKQNTCNSPAECALVDNNSTKEAKATCGAAISQLLSLNGNRFSFTKLITPCNGDLPAASIEPITFVAVRSKNLLKNRKANLSNKQNSNSDVIDFSKLSDDQKNLLNSAKTTASENTDTTVSIDGVTKDPASVNVAADLAVIDAAVQDSQNSVVEQVKQEVAQETAANGAGKLGFSLFTVLVMLFALLI